MFSVESGAHFYMATSGSRMKFKRPPGSLHVPLSTFWTVSAFGKVLHLTKDS